VLHLLYEFGLLIFTLLVSLAVFVSNSKADSTQEKTYNWTGAYAGANLGAVWSGSRFTANNVVFLPDSGTYSGSINATDLNPGVQLGYLKQFKKNWVVGAEADFTYPSSSGHYKYKDTVLIGQYDQFTLHNNLQGSLRLRAGYAIECFLPFITVGVSFADVGLSYNNELKDNYSKNITQTGWVLGGGLEYGVLSNLSVRTEYLFTDYGKALNLNIPTLANFTDSTGGAQGSLYSHVVRAAINYRF